MRLSSAVPVRSAQIIVAGKVLMVCEAVAEAVRAHRIGKDQAEAAQEAAEEALVQLDALRRVASVNRWPGRIA